MHKINQHVLLLVNAGMRREKCPLVQLKSTEKIKARRDIVTLLHHLSCGVEQLIYNTLRWVKSRSILCPSEPVFSLMCNQN